MVKSKIKNTRKPNQTEKNLFFASVGAGMMGGLLGNIIVTSYFNLMNYYNVGVGSTWIMFVIALLAFCGITRWFYKQIKFAQIS